MILERLHLYGFRNYRDVTVAFAPGGAYIIGANGSGKTSLLEAVYYLANHVSFRTARREELLSWGTTQGALSATVLERRTQQRRELAVRLTPQGRRFWLDGKEVRDPRRLAAAFAAVVFHPGTLLAVKGGPAARRQLVDRGILSLQPAFMRLHHDFQRVLRQRNAMLRTAAGTPAYGVWTERFVEVALRLMQARRDHLVRLNHLLSQLLQQLGPDLGPLTLTYRPGVALPEEVGEEAAWRAALEAAAQRLRRAEEAVGQTLFGPQRDDVLIRWRGKETRGYASQGEQRLVAFLLVAALAVGIEAQWGHRPVMLLDDVVSELDERHRMVIFDFLKTHAFQVLLTDVEERPLYRDLSPLVPIRLRCHQGWAELASGGWDR